MSLIIRDRIIRLDDILGIEFRKGFGGDYGYVTVFYKFGSEKKDFECRFHISRQEIYDHVQRAVASIFINPKAVYNLCEMIDLVVKTPLWYWETAKDA